MDNSKTIQKENYVSELLRYLSFWPYFLMSFFLFIFLAYSFLRYADYQYSTTATIEILDKAQDSEMALPTAMTVFNRSMINLDNEISVLGSYKLHKRVCEKLPLGKLIDVHRHLESLVCNHMQILYMSLQQQKHR